MDATAYVVEKFDELVRLGIERVPEASKAEQVLFYVVAARCEKDINSFSSIFEQLLRETQLSVLVAGLRSIDEEELADAFDRGLQLLRGEKFYDHLNWHKVSTDVRRQIDDIGDEIGDRMWALDEKLAALVRPG